MYAQAFNWKLMIGKVVILQVTYGSVTYFCMPLLEAPPFYMYIQLVFVTKSLQLCEQEQSINKKNKKKGKRKPNYIIY